MEEELKHACYVAKLIIKGYEKQSGGHSQKEALKTLISFIEGLPSEKELYDIVASMWEAKHISEKIHHRIMKDETKI